MRSLAVILCVAACNSDATPPPKPQPLHARDAAVALDGAASYQALCAPCHGADAKGYKADHAPSLVNPTFLESASDDFVRRSIIYGRPGTSMAAYGREVGGPLDARAIEQIVGWLREQGGKPIALVAGAIGDASRGAPLYVKDCQTCHGDLATRGEGVHLANARFLSIATDPFLRWAIVHGRPGTKMEPWSGKLGDQQIDDVVAYVRAFGKPLPEPAAGTDRLPPPTGKEPIVINPHGRAPAFDVRADPCPPQQLGAPACVPDPRYVSADQVKRALDDKRRLVIIDARPPSDWMRAHATGAVSIPYHDMKRLDEIPNDGTWVIAYCACPHHLSGIVVDELRKRGYKHAVVLDEGILEWHRRGYPVVAAPGVTAPAKEPVLAPGTLR